MKRVFWHKKFQALEFMILALVLTLVTGCEEHKLDPQAFQERIKSKLGMKDSIEITASDLSDFKWEQLCFFRDEKIKLIFHTNDNEKTISLSYDSFFIEEPYVEGSPADKCISNNQSLIFKYKYSRKSNIIEIKLNH